VCCVCRVFLYTCSAIVQSNSIVEQEDWAAPRKSGALTAEVVCNTNRALQSLHTRIQNQKSAQQFAQSYFDSLESRPSWHSFFFESNTDGAPTTMTRGQGLNSRFSTMVRHGSDLGP